MLEVTDANAYKNDFDNNMIIGTPSLINSKITFKGKNNIIFCENGTRLRNSNIYFNADNSAVYIGKNDITVGIQIYNDSVCRIGKGTYVNNKLFLMVSESKHIFIGDECMFSFGIWMRTADPHLIYSSETCERINYSKSIFVGDHVWIGQSALLLKGTRIGSGSVIGGGSVISNKLVPSNTSYAGNPVKEVGRNLFWTPVCTHTWTEEDTAAMRKCEDGGRYIYSADKDSRFYEVLDERFTEAAGSAEKLDILKEIADNSDKNRFAVLPRNIEKN